MVDSIASGVALGASAAVVAAVVLYVTLPERLTLGPVWLLPVLELALLVPLAVAVQVRHARETVAHRTVSIALIVVVNASERRLAGAIGG